MRELKQWFLADSLTSKYAEFADSVYARSGLYGLTDWLIKLHISEGELLTDILLISFQALRGNKEEALTCLEKLLKENDGEVLRAINNSDVDSLRAEPRFKAMVSKLGLTEYYNKAIPSR